MVKNMKTLTLKQRAETLGLSASHLCRIEKCALNARGLLAKRLADLTNTDLALWLVGGTGTPEARKAAIQSWAEGNQPPNIVESEPEINVLAAFTQGKDMFDIIAGDGGTQ